MLFYNFVSHSPVLVSRFATMLINFAKSSIIVKIPSPIFQNPERVGGRHFG
jgi:hypothetical protein